MTHLFIIVDQDHVCRATEYFLGDHLHIFFSKCEMSICVVFGQHWFSPWSSLMDAVFALSLSCCWIMNTNLYWGKWKLQCFSCCSWSFPLKKMWRNTETTFPVRIQQKTFKSNYLGHIYLFFGFIYATVRTDTKQLQCYQQLDSLCLHLGKKLQKQIKAVWSVWYIQIIIPNMWMPVFFFVSH